MSTTLFYIHDPMCSWCWGFRPTWLTLQHQLPPHIRIQYVLGGLAPDSQTPMPTAMQQRIQQHWHTIRRKIPGTVFNFDFWTKNQPRRATWPACRAVIATRRQRPAAEHSMILAIQRAYYIEARNPSDDDVLIRLAGKLGLDVSRFQHDLNSTATQRELEQEIALRRKLGANSFPSLILQCHGRCYVIPVDYRRAETMQQHITALADDAATPLHPDPHH